MNTQLDNFDIDELAAELCGLDSDKVDVNDIDSALIDKWDITLDQFQNVMKAVWPLLAIGVSPLSEKAQLGFVNKDKTMWIAKGDITLDFVNCVLQWMGVKDMARDGKGMIRTIANNGKAEYEIHLLRAKIIDVAYLEANLGKKIDSGLTINPILDKSAVRWVAKVGDGTPDWAIYYHTPDKSDEWIMMNGNKTTTESVIRGLIACTDEAFANYRY